MGGFGVGVSVGVGIGVGVDVVCIIVNLGVIFREVFLVNEIQLWEGLVGGHKRGMEANEDLSDKLS